MLNVMEWVKQKFSRGTTVALYIEDIGKFKQTLLEMVLNTKGEICNGGKVLNG